MIEPATLLLLRRFAPYAIAAIAAFGLGLSAGWYVQGVNLAALENKFQECKNEQVRQSLEARKAADDLRDKTAAGWAAALDKLRSDHDAYARCVAAGRCLPRDLPTCPSGSGLSAPGRTDVVGGGSPVPPATGVAGDGLIADCRKTQLKLNTLRAQIRNQAGYRSFAD